MKYHFAITATLLAESSLGSGLGHDEAYMIADIYSQKSDKAAACNELQPLLEDMCLDFAKRIGEIKKDDIISIHIRKCIDHIYEDLNADLSTKGLADFTKLNVSYLSKLFKQETGQTVKAYVTAAKMDTLYQTIMALTVEQGLSFADALSVATSNVAHALKLYPQKGAIAVGSDGDVVILDEHNQIDTVIAKGQLMMLHKELLVKGLFESF